MQSGSFALQHGNVAIGILVDDGLVADILDPNNIH